MNSILYIIAFYFIGECLTDLLHLPFPGSISGFLLALLTILVVPAVASKLRPGSETLLGYLPLFLVPVAVSIFSLFLEAGKNLYFFAGVVLAALFFGIVATALTLKVFLQRETKKLTK